MMPGMPGGRQLAESLSSARRDTSSWRFAAYAGVNCGPAGAPPARPASAPPPRGAAPPGAPPWGAAPRAAPAGAGGRPASHTPLKSGSFAMAAQSAAVGALVFQSCALTVNTAPNASTAATKDASANDRCVIRAPGPVAANHTQERGEI